MSSSLQNLIDSINNMQTDRILLNPPQPIMTLTTVEVKNSKMNKNDLHKNIQKQFKRLMSNVEKLYKNKEMLERELKKQKS